MDSKPRQAPSPSSDASTSPHHGYGGYSGYGYGYGYGGEQSNAAAQRTFQQYLLTLRERVWYIVLVFLAIFLSVLVWTLAQQKSYESVAKVQIFRHDPVVMKVQDVMNNDVMSAEDLNTQVKILESDTVLTKVAEHLSGPSLDRLLRPYRNKNGQAPGVLGLLKAHRKIVPQRLSLMIDIDFDHPDPEAAALAANSIVDEYIAYTVSNRVEGSLKAVEELKDRADEQRKKVGQMAIALQNYRQKNSLVSLDQRKDINTEKLKALSAYVTETANRLADADVHWKQVQEQRQKKQDLTDLTFLANQPLIVQLTGQVSAQKIAIAQLRNHYRDQHPTMIQAKNSLAQTEQELTRAVDSAAAAVEADYQTALRNSQEARQALAAQEEASLKLDRYGVEYENLDRDYAVNVKLLDDILSRMGETSMSGTIESQSARVVDRATPALRPSRPNVSLNVGLGFVGGLVMGVACAFFFAFIDDRVKSVFDIENVVGLPLLGVVPHMKGENAQEKGTVVVNDADRLVAEAFRSLYASLRLKEESKAAKCLLVTSTLPGEGKSFIVTNTALAFAAHGGRTIIIDCDLRRPSIHRALELENKRGVIDLVAGRVTSEQAIVHTKFPGLDALPSGGRAHNPTQVLNDPAFERLLAELRTRYDYIFLDTPPLAAVSDALMILPLTDGCLFTLCFNKVRRKAAQFCAHKVLETNVPCFGAVLNNLNLNVSGYYYSQYYDKSYKDYYMTAAKDGE
jgi:capsular exopolysaccharide synthesis family protein